MANNKILERMFRLSAQVDDDTGLAVTSVLEKIEDGQPLKESDWATIFLQIALRERSLDRLKRATFKAHALPAQDLVWDTQEASFKWFEESESQEQEGRQ